MTTIPIDIRAPREREADLLADLHERAWLSAYRGIIPAVALDRFVAERDGRWWQRTIRRRRGVTVLDFDGSIAGYVMAGPIRRRVLPADAELYELYLDPDYQGVGLGRRLFETARTTLKRGGMKGLAVWSLDANESGMRFYRAVGGQPFARSTETFGGTDLPKTAFIWR